MIAARVLVFKIKTKEIIKSDYEVAETRWFNQKETDVQTHAFTHDEILKKYWRLKR